MTFERLSAGDRFMLMAGDIWPQEIGALAVLDGCGLWDDGGRLRLEALRDRIERRIGLVPRLRQVIVQASRGLGGPFWADAPRFDTGDHVHVLQIDSPGGEPELLAAAERIRRQRLDPSRPGWEFWFLTGLPERRVGMYAKLHHAMADGMAAMTIIDAFLDGAAGEETAAPAPVWRPRPWPRRRDLLADNLYAFGRSVAGSLRATLHPRAAWHRLVASAPALLELLAEEPPPSTSLDGVVGLDRRLAVLRCDLAGLRALARQHDATPNDVLLALIAGGLRSLLIARGEAVDGLWLPIYVPISMRRRWRGPVTGNRVAQMAVPLPVGVGDPDERLARIASATAERKTRDRTAAGKLFRSSVATRLLLMAVDRQRVNACSANVPGPRLPRFLLRSRVLEVVPILPLIGRVSLGVGALSYEGTLAIGVTADSRAFPDLDRFVTGMCSELTSLGGQIEAVP